MDKQTLVFAFLLTVLVALWLRELYRWLQEGDTGLHGRIAEAGAAAGDGQVTGVCLDEFAADVASLLLLVKAVHSSAPQEEGAILAYGRISEYASRIGMAAEERRLTLARTQLENSLTEDVRYRDVLELPMES